MSNNHHRHYRSKFQSRVLNALPLAVLLAILVPRLSPAAKSSPAVQPQIPRPALALLDDFSNPAPSKARWSPLATGACTINFQPHNVIMDMPGSPNGDNKAQLFSKIPLHLTHAGDTLRVTWDMQLLEDRHQAFGFGLVLGDPAGNRIVAAQYGQKSGSMGPPHDVFLSGTPIPGDKIDHGTGPLHYDVIVTLQNPATGSVTFSMLVFNQISSLNASPDSYLSAATPIASLSSTGSIPATGEIPLYFCLERDDAQPDPYRNTPRGKISLSNVFTSAPARSAPSKDYDASPHTTPTPPTPESELP